MVLKVALPAQDPLGLHVEVSLTLALRSQLGRFPFPKEGPLSVVVRVLAWIFHVGLGLQKVRNKNDDR